MLKRLIGKLTTPFDEIVIFADDSDDVRLGKQIFVRFCLVLILVTFFLGVQGVVIADSSLTITGFFFSFLFFSNLVLLKRSHRVRLHIYIFVLTTMLVPFVWSAIFGGFNLNSYDLWLSFSPLMLVVLISDRRVAIRWFLAFSALVILSGFLEPYVANPANVPATQTFLIISNTLVAAVVTFLILMYYKREKNSAQRLLALEQEKSENLLLNILPKGIAEILKEEEGTIAEHFDQASVLFADIVGFTPLSLTMAPDEMVGLLNEIFPILILWWKNMAWRRSRRWAIIT